MKSSAISHLFPGVDPSSISFLPLLDQFHEGVTITDERGVVLYMNAAQAHMDDLVVATAVGQKVTDLYQLDEGISPTMTCLNTGQPLLNYACYYRTHLGRVVNSLHNIYPIYADDRLIGSICHIRDYQNIEQTLTMVGKTLPRRGVSTFGLAEVKHRTSPRKNGTRYTFDDIIGADPDLLAAVKSARLASDSPSPIMIYGETGTGKELIAQSIHNRSPRSAKPYMAVNCVAIPENLLEGMLFGTSKGAFTGAINKPGLFETADGGTLFLDEINSMPLNLQAKLLRFLQERKVRRVGAMKEIDVDLKIISSVNNPPHEAITSGSLRADLFYRLAVVLIELPSLRDRMGDLNRLASHFLVKTNAILDKQVTGIAMDVMLRFERYHWPGNVRELEHVIEGAMNMAGDDQIIAMHHLSVPLKTEALPMKSTTTSLFSKVESRLLKIRKKPLPVIDNSVAGKTLAQITREQEIITIQAALTETRGNAAQAARKIGISPQLLNYKLKRLGIDRRLYKTTK